MYLFETILHFFTLLLFIYLAVSILYLLVLAIAGRYKQSTLYSTTEHKKNILVLIPSFREDQIIIATAQQAALHNYPATHFTVAVIADQLQPATIAALKNIPVAVIEVAFETSMKSKSLNAALNSFNDTTFDIALVLDADNVMGAGCLEQVNTAFQSGYRVMQCHRTAKNQQTPVALLDAISEEINNNIFRKGQRALGLPSSLIGSGIAFEFSLLKQIFNTPAILSNPGEDREIDVQLVQQNIDVAFIDQAFVYDEKVANKAVFQKQRVRWMEAQVEHIKRFLAADLAHLRTSRIFLHKFFQCFLLPRLLYLALFGCIAVVIWLQYVTGFSFLYPAPTAWVTCIVLYMLVLFISIPSRFLNRQTGKAVLHIPGLIIAMLKAMLKMKSGRKEFLHTPKTYTGN